MLAPWTHAKRWITRRRDPGFAFAPSSTRSGRGSSDLFSTQSLQTRPGEKRHVDTLDGSGWLATIITCTRTVCCWPYCAAPFPTLWQSVDAASRARAPEIAFPMKTSSVMLWTVCRMSPYDRSRGCTHHRRLLHAHPGAVVLLVPHQLVGITERTVL